MRWESGDIAVTMNFDRMGRRVFYKEDVNGEATVSIQVKQASKLDGEWEVVEDGEVSVEITPKAGEKAAFYKFVVPNEQ